VARNRSRIGKDGTKRLTSCRSCTRSRFGDVEASAFSVALEMWGSPRAQTSSLGSQHCCRNLRMETGRIYTSESIVRIICEQEGTIQQLPSAHGRDDGSAVETPGQVRRSPLAPRQRPKGHCSKSAMEILLYPTFSH